MSKSNGKHLNKVKVTELMLDSGVRVYVRPLSQYTRQVVFQRLREKFPYPAESDYDEQIEGSDSPGAIIPITNEQNSRYAEYQELVNKADNERNRGYFEVIIEMCITWVDSSQEALIDQYAEHINDLSRFADLGDDTWLNTLYHGVCASQGDINEILEACHEQIDIMEAEPSEEDIHAAWRVFRPRISRAERSRLDNYAPLLQEIAKLRGKV